VIQDTYILNSLVVKCQSTNALPFALPPFDGCIALPTPSHIWWATQGRLKTLRVATISWFADKSACCCRRCRCFYRYLYRYSIASYAIAMAFPYTSSSHASIQFGIWFGIRFYSISQSRLPLFDILRRRTSFYDCFTTTFFFFLLHDKSLYEDEYESNTCFLTRDACRLAKD